MSTRMTARFILSGRNFNMYEVTGLLGLRPTATWRAGETVPGTTQTSRESCWCLSSEAVPTLDMQQVISSLLKQIEPAKSKILETCANFQLRATVVCVIQEEGARPALRLDAAAVGLLATLGAGLEVCYGAPGSR